MPVSMAMDTMVRVSIRLRAAGWVRDAGAPEVTGSKVGEEGTEAWMPPSRLSRRVGLVMDGIKNTPFCFWYP